MEKKKGGVGGPELICGAHFIFDPRYRLEFDQFHSITSLFILFYISYTFHCISTPGALTWAF